MGLDLGKAQEMELAKELEELSHHLQHPRFAEEPEYQLQKKHNPTHLG